VASRKLDVWLHGTRVAELTTRGPGQITCRYTKEAQERWQGGVPLLSCSLPLASTRYHDSGRWFRGLLPEGRALQAMAERARVPAYDTFGMLARFGRDVAGAVIIAEEDSGPRPGDVEAYTTDALEEEVAGLEDRPLALHDDSELSLPGLQNKLLLIELDGRWGRPIGGRPSTHILKAEDRRYPGLITMEAACLRLARAVGLTAVEVAVETFADIDCLIVSRFDRRIVDGTVVRVHQEDACQALGRDPESNHGRGKYEANGGPSLAEVADLLDRYAKTPLEELPRLISAVTFTVAIGNADAHGKNLAFLHDPTGFIQLAPLYDTVPTALWPKLPTRAAMRISGRVGLAEVTLEDIVAEARAWRLDSSQAETAAVSTLRGLLAAVEADAGLPEPLALHVVDRCYQLLG
jgi:serine/threonine-protein kinase HipA